MMVNSMSSTKYQEFIKTLEPEFIKLIHKNEIPSKYQNEDREGITLEELEILDNQFINMSKDKV